LSDRRPITVAFLVQDFSSGGIPVWINTICRELHRTDPGRFAFHFMCTHGWEIREHFYEIGAPVFLGNRGRSPNWLVWRRVTKYLKNLRPDIVQFSNLREYRDICRKVRPPVVIARMAGQRSLHRYDLAGVDGVILNNWELFRMLEFPPERKFVITHGVDLEAIRQVVPNRLHFASDDIIIGQVSRIGRGQNQRLLIDAVTRLRERHPQVKMVLVGGTTAQPGAEDVLPELRERAAPLGSNAVLTGHVDAPIPLVAGFSIATCTATREFGEGVPRKLVEPMALGIPCVTTDSGQTRDCVEDGVSGFVVEDDNLGQFTERLERLVVDRPLREAMGRAARAKAEREFDVRVLAAQVKGMWLSLLGNRL
jgi:glycosyltransferase involved in cell wall biosynthesis